VISIPLAIPFQVFLASLGIIPDAGVFHRLNAFLAEIHFVGFELAAGTPGPEPRTTAILLGGPLVLVAIVVALFGPDAPLLLRTLGLVVVLILVLVLIFVAIGPLETVR